MNKAKFYESEFETIVIDKLEALGWKYTAGMDLHRKETDAIYEPDLRTFLNNQYIDECLSEYDIDAAVAKIKHQGGTSTYRAMAEIVKLVREGYDFKSSNPGAKPFRMEYIDFVHPEHNIFRVVNQFTYYEGAKNYRPDIMLFVNGIPLVIFELKNPANKTATVRKAHQQITNRYWFNMPSLMKYLPLSVVSDNAKTLFGTTTSPLEYFYAWKKVENEDEPAKKGAECLDTLIKGALAPMRLLEIYRDFLYFPDQAEGEEKELAVVCRYPQFFAARKLKDSILANLKSRGGNGKGGLYFGATGCGKTYTMLFLSRLLSQRCRDKLGSPTVLLIVDREDLETQAGRLFCTSKDYLCDNAVKIFESRQELKNEMKSRKNGGFYITTIQKFTESTGLLSDRSNIICMSDEAHRTQNNIGSKLKADELEAYISWGFAKYLRDALPNATYCGFTGTPIDDAVAVFGGIVDSYTMKQSQADGITVPIVYDPRLARANLDAEKAEAIEAYYKLCEKEGASEKDVILSKKAMSDLNVILSDPKRLERIAVDVVTDFEARLAEHPGLTQKGMIVCNDRKIAYALYKLIAKERPDWVKPMKALPAGDEHGHAGRVTLPDEEWEKLKEVPFVNIVATRNEDDPHEMYGVLGDHQHRADLAELYKDDKSNFKLAIVVDMWITGFDCPSLAFLYNDKPLKKHTLIQTISRVNRIYKTKACGIIIDYFGIRENMKEALKTYGGEGGDGTTERDVNEALKILRRELDILKTMCHKLDFAPFISGSGPEKLQFLQNAAEFVLSDPEKKDGEDESGEKKPLSFFARFSAHVKRLSSAHAICNPAGVLEVDETIWCRCFIGIYSYAVKMTRDPHESVDTMNRTVEKMVAEAIKYTKVETILGHDEHDLEYIFSEDFMKEIEEVKMPNTKFQLLVQMLRRAITEYKKTNKVKAEYFEKMLAETVEEYNTRDKLVFTNQVAQDTVDAVNNMIVQQLNEKLKGLLKSIKDDKDEFKALGISFEEKAFYDVLVNIRDTHNFEYPDEKCKTLAKKIKLLVDNTSVYADWLNNDSLKSQLNSDLTKLIYWEGYPPEWDEEVFNQVLAQVENYKKHED